jgi:hypothetical protein
MYRVEHSTKHNSNPNDFGDDTSGQSNSWARSPSNVLRFTRFVQKTRENFSQRITIWPPEPYTVDINCFYYVKSPFQYRTNKEQFCLRIFRIIIMMHHTEKVPKPILYNHIHNLMLLTDRRSDYNGGVTSWVPLQDNLKCDWREGVIRATGELAGVPMWRHRDQLPFTIHIVLFQVNLRSKETVVKVTNFLHTAEIPAV